MATGSGRADGAMKKRVRRAGSRPRGAGAGEAALGAPLLRLLGRPGLDRPIGCGSPGGCFQPGGPLERGECAERAGRVSGARLRGWGGLVGAGRERPGRAARLELCGTRLSLPGPAARSGR